MGGPQKSEFRKLELDSSKLSELHKERMVDGKEFEDKFRFSMDAYRNQTRMRGVKQDLFNERFQVKKPKKGLIGKWTEKFNRWTFKNKQIGHFAKKDLDDHAKKQIEIQRDRWNTRGRDLYAITGGSPGGHHDPHYHDHDPDDCDDCESHGQN